VIQVQSLSLSLLRMRMVKKSAPKTLNLS
jgi:hypothetical protein